MQYQLKNLTNHSQLTLVQQQNNQAVFQAIIINQQDAQRTALEHFIRDTFSRHYHADILHFYPYLLGAFEQSQPFAAIGYRHADEQALFLEQYLSAPVEQELENINQTPVTREQIVEIGNLAATRPGACLLIFQLLSLYFHNSNIRWVTFTSTRTVRIALKRLCIQTCTLTPAYAEQLDDPQNWGSYYEYQPIVIAAPVTQTIAAISNRYQLLVA